MAIFDPLPYAISLFLWLCIAVVVREFDMLEILVVIVVVGIVALIAAVRFTARPTDLSEDI